MVVEVLQNLETSKVALSRMALSLLTYVLLYHASSTTFDCKKNGFCADGNYICDDDEDCFIKCQGDKSCHNSFFTCPKSTNATKTVQCAVECNGHNACSNAKFDSYYTDTLIYYTTGHTSTEGASISCPCGINGTCNIDCGGYGSCSRMKVYANKGSLSLIGSSEYAFLR